MEGDRAASMQGAGRGGEQPGVTLAPYALWARQPTVAESFLSVCGKGREQDRYFYERGVVLWEPIDNDSIG